MRRDGNLPKPEVPPGASAAERTAMLATAASHPAWHGPCCLGSAHDIGQSVTQSTFSAHHTPAQRANHTAPRSK